jgi:23S rRNA (cytidine1920-2'-O)/16S rRNA (cytidine1409-2'-O)-methyltransferase
VRLDRLLVERGLAPSRERAQRLVMAGDVLVDDRPVSKPGTEVVETAVLRLRSAPSPYASRGGEKLAGALDAFGLSMAGRVVLDVGASTGGFTDVCLRRGARRVIAVDVGYGQLAWSLRQDPRVTVLDRTNARTLARLPFAPQLVVCDVSFISVRAALPAVLRLATPGWEGLVLVKPQFEAGRAEVRKGVVRDPLVHRRVLREVVEAACGWDAQAAGVVDSGLPGPKGNHEFVLYLIHSEHAELPPELDRWIADATG